MEPVTIGGGLEMPSLQTTEREVLFVIRDVLFMFKAPDHYGIENRKKVASHV